MRGFHRAVIFVGRTFPLSSGEMHEVAWPDRERRNHRDFAVKRPCSGVLNINNSCVPLGHGMSLRAGHQRTNHGVQGSLRSPTTRRHLASRRGTHPRSVSSAATTVISWREWWPRKSPARTITWKRTGKASSPRRTYQLSGGETHEVARLDGRALKSRTDLAVCCCLFGGDTGDGPSNGDRRPISRATTCKTQATSVNAILGSRSSGSHPHRHAPGHGQTRNATHPAIPPRTAGRMEKVRLWPFLANSTPAPITVSQLPSANNADGTPRSKQMAHKIASTQSTLREPNLRVQQQRDAMRCDQPGER